MTLLLVILFLGFKAAIFVAVSTVALIFILYMINPKWFKHDSPPPEDDFKNIEL